MGAPKAVLRLPQSLAQGFRHRHCIMGNIGTGSLALAQCHPKGLTDCWSEKNCRGTEETWAAQNQSCQHRELSAPTHACPTCGNTFCARTGLISHLRTHRTQFVVPKSTECYRDVNLILWPHTVNYVGMSTVLINYDGRTTTTTLVTNHNKCHVRLRAINNYVYIYVQLS